MPSFRETKSNSTKLIDSKSQHNFSYARLEVFAMFFSGLETEHDFCSDKRSSGLAHSTKKCRSPLECGFRVVLNLDLLTLCSRILMLANFSCLGMDVLSNSDSSLTKDVFIRSYKNEDYTQCREVFTEGMQQLVNPVMTVVYPRYLKIAGIILMFISAITFRWSPWIVGLYLILCVVMTALLYIDIYIEVMKFVSGCLNTDLLNIAESYREGSRVFVAELHGQVVGMVGLIQGEHLKAGVAELQRMSVSRTVRRRGIAKLLCKEVIAFAKEQNLNKIILSTTGAQDAATALYMKFGFKLTEQFPYPQKVLEELAYVCYELEI